MLIKRTGSPLDRVLYGLVVRIADGGGEALIEERADAARNRQAILDAADRLFAGTPAPESVSMDEIAQAAGVGKGTLFRRFGDRASLIRAVYARRAEPLREQIERGPAPLGPATPNRERLAAILDAFAQLKIDNAHLTLALEGPGSVGSAGPYDSPAYREAHLLLTGLLEPDHGQSARLIAHTLLAAVRADLLGHLVEEEGMNRRQISEHVARLVVSVAGYG
jgi:AcrR family transcriptional regulator